VLITFPTTSNRAKEKKNEAQLTKGQLRLGWAGHARGGGDGGRLPLQFLNGEIVPDR